MSAVEALAYATQYLAVLEKYASRTQGDVSNILKTMIDDVKRHVSLLSQLSGISGSGTSSSQQVSVNASSVQRAMYSDPMITSMYNVIGSVLGLAVLQMIAPIISEVTKPFASNTKGK